MTSSQYRRVAFLRATAEEVYTFAFLVVPFMRDCHFAIGFQHGRHQFIHLYISFVSEARAKFYQFAGPLFYSDVRTSAYLLTQTSFSDSLYIAGK